MPQDPGWDGGAGSGVALTYATSADEFRKGSRYLFVFLDDLFPTPAASSDHYIKRPELADTLSTF